jgi:TOMM system kinase/cyclase fusion protein
LNTAEVLGAALRGQYELRAALGEGGFGTVFAAQQAATGQQVAIKVLRLPVDSTPEANERRIARFQREMRLCAQLHHPNIVRLIDSGKADDGIVYSIFEFAPGKNLAQVLTEEGALNPHEARHLMMQLLDALACAHSQGVVHRDLKPANIMVIPTGARRNALVLDFGIGALMEDSSDSGAHITRTQEIIGTPAYAAPEQLRGERPTPRSDIYSWGLVYLECLTGKRVFQGSTSADIIFRQLSPEPAVIPPFIAAHPLGELLRRATAKEPGARDVTTVDLLRELEACDMNGLHPDAVPLQGQRLGMSAEAAAAERESTSQRQLVDGERRQITAVCCSLSVHPLDGAGADAERSDHVITLQQEACNQIVRCYAGHVASIMGDTMLFYFGYPVAYEDDAVRAARAALEMHAELSQREAVLLAEHKVRIELRIGIHTGLVVARELRSSAGPGFAAGATPKLALSLSRQAPTGAVLVSGDTQRLLRKRFFLDRAGERDVERTETPMEVFLLQDGAPSEELAETPLVGRGQELELLTERWSRVLAGTGQAVLIAGEPGIGKSRLVNELKRKLRSVPLTWMESRCLPESANRAFYPLTYLLDRLMDPRREAKSADKVGKLEALLSSYGFELAEAMPLFTSLLSLPLPERWRALEVSPQRQREMTRNALLSLLVEMADREPVVLRIEDLHWADPSTLELLSQLVGEVSSARIYALFTARTEFNPSWPTAAVFQLQLGRLGRAEIEQLAVRLISGRELPLEAIDRIAVKTDGIPLFVEELVLMLLESGLLMERDGRYVLTQPLTDANIPSTLRDSLVARLDRLQRAKETAQVASAIGREFTLELLREVLPLDPTGLQEDLDKLIAADLVHRKRRLKSAVFVFKHALIRDAAYDSMLKRTRQQVHARIARALEEKFPEVAGERPDLLAHHYAAAEQKREAIGYGQKAALAALTRSAYAESSAATRQALGWLDALPEEHARNGAELELNGLLLPALMATRGYASADLETVLLRSQTLLGGLEAHPQAFVTCWALFVCRHIQGHSNQALELAQQLQASAERSGDSGHRVMALIAMGDWHFFSGDFMTSRSCLEQARDLYQPEVHRPYAALLGHDLKVHAQSKLGLLLWLMGYPDQSLTQATAALAWARESNHLNSVCLALVYLGGVRHYRKEADEVRAIATELLQFADRFGFDQWKLLGGVLRAWAERELGTAQKVLSIFDAVGMVQARPYWSSMVAEIEAQLGQHDEALARLSEGIRMSVDTQETYYLPELHRLHGMCLLARGIEAAPAAEQSFQFALETARRHGARMPELRAALALARMLKERGEVSAARGVLEPSVSWFTEGFGTCELGDARALLSALG